MSESTSDTTDIVEDHLSDFFDENDEILVYDDFKSDIIQTDIYIVKATKDRPFHILLSCGMSAVPMEIPEEVEVSPYAELMMLLPRDWKLTEESLENERNLWPIRQMVNLMSKPHQNKTWFEFGQAHVNESGKEFAEGMGFNSFMLAYSMELMRDFTQISTEEGKTVDIYTMIPLYKEELAYLEKNDAEDLLEKFDAYGIEEIIEVGRKNIGKA